MAMGAVITGDVVASTAIGRVQFKRLLREFETILATHKHEFYRGDSFQVYVKDPADALLLVLQLRVAAMRLAFVSTAPANDVRAAIGIGQVKPPVKIVRTATDEAFVLSGRAFDALKSPDRLVISVPDAHAVAATGLQVAGSFADYLLQKMTTKQAAVVFDLLQNRTQKETARRLRKSQATIHKHVQAAGWPQLEKILMAYRQLTASVIL